MVTTETPSTEMVSTDAKDFVSEPKYRVLSVEKADPPAGMPEGNWFRYVIGQDASRIEGFKPGSLQAVTQHAEDFVQNLNARSAKGYSSYAARKQKK